MCEHETNETQRTAIKYSLYQSLWKWSSTVCVKFLPSTHFLRDTSDVAVCAGDLHGSWRQTKTVVCSRHSKCAMRERHHKVATRLNKLIFNSWSPKRCIWKHVLCRMKCNTCNSRTTILHDSYTRPKPVGTVGVMMPVNTHNYVLVTFMEVSFIVSQSAGSKKWTHWNSSPFPSSPSVSQAAVN
jgi:hypothetical protein